MWSRVALATALTDHILWLTQKPLESEWAEPRTERQLILGFSLHTEQYWASTPSLPPASPAVLWPHPLRFCLREMVLVNKQALRLVPLGRGCQGARASSRRGTAALTRNERGACIVLSGQCGGAPLSGPFVVCSGQCGMLCAKHRMPCLWTPPLPLPSPSPPLLLPSPPSVSNSSDFFTGKFFVLTTSRGDQEGGVCADTASLFQIGCPNGKNSKSQMVNGKRLGRRCIASQCVHSD